jgi:hypothetical protein
MALHMKSKVDNLNIYRRRNTDSRKYQKHLKKTVYENSLIRTSKKNVELLAAICGITQIETEGDLIGQMRGMLKGYSDPRIDSVELVHAVRGQL